MPATVYLVSGSNRGIGLALVKALVARPDVIIFAGTRKPAAAAELQALAKSNKDKFHVLKLTSAEEADNRAAVEEIKKIAGRLDVVISNAGIANHDGPSIDTPLKAMREHFEVNVLGALALFQAAYPLLKASTPSPKFVAISSTAGSVTIAPPLPFIALPYGMSKASLNYVVRKLRADHDGLVCFPLCPGTVDTDLSAASRETVEEMAHGHHIEWHTPDAVAPHILARIDEATRETDAFARWSDDHFEEIPW